VIACRDDISLIPTGVAALEETFPNNYSSYTVCSNQWYPVNKKIRKEFNMSQSGGAGKALKLVLYLFRLTTPDTHGSRNEKGGRT